MVATVCLGGESLGYLPRLQRVDLVNGQEVDGRWARGMI